MRVFTPQDIYDIDRHSTTCGISVTALMGNAGTCLARVALNKADNLPINKNRKPNILAVCGGGNNGGDGIAAAIELHKSGKVKIYLSVCSSRLSTAAQHYYDLAVSTGVPILSEPHTYDGYDIIIDALLGIGIKGNVNARFADIISDINKSNAYIISADIPSGINGYNGLVSGTAVKAYCVVAFTGVKTGLLLNDAKDYYNELVVQSVGETLPSGLSDIYTVAGLALPARKKNSHKGNYPSVRVMGGCFEMVGAPLMSTEAALRSGAGIVKLGVSKALGDAYRQRIKEGMLYYFESNDDGSIKFGKEALDGFLQGADSVVLGMGMPVNDDLKTIVKHILTNYRISVVLDAGALECVDKNDLVTTECKVIITPHPLEFARIAGLDLPTVLADGINQSKIFADKYRCVVNLKGSSSIITDGQKTYIEYEGTPAMAKGGSGDVLGGVTAAFCGVMTLPEGAAYAAYVCSRAASLAAGQLGEHCVIASDIIDRIGQVLL